MRAPKILTARDLMARRLVTLHADASMADAAGLLVRRNVSGAPVVDADGRLVGLLSDFDCLRAFRSELFDWDDRDVTCRVSDFMTRDVLAVEPQLDVYGVADRFLQHAVRRLVVVEDDRPVGLISRRDLMRGIDQMRRELLERARYPDYPQERIPLLSRHRAHRQRELPAHSTLRRPGGR